MKKKNCINFSVFYLPSLCCLLLLSLSSPSVFSWVGSPDVKILSTKIICKGKGDCETKTLAPLGGKHKSGTAWSLVEDEQHFVNENFEIQSFHQVVINNPTNKTQNYGYSFELECDGNSQYYWREIELPPDGSYEDRAKLLVQMKKKTIGKWPMQSSTKVTGADDKTDSHLATLTVTERNK